MKQFFKLSFVLVAVSFFVTAVSCVQLESPQGASRAKPQAHFLINGTDINYDLVGSSAVPASPESRDALKNILAFGSTRHIKKYAEAGKNINAPVFESGNHILLEAMRLSKIELALFLLMDECTADDVDLLHKNIFGYNALTYSMVSGNKAVFDALLTFNDYRFFSCNIEAELRLYEEELNFYFKVALTINDLVYRNYIIAALSKKFKVDPFIVDGIVFISPFRCIVSPH